MLFSPSLSLCTAYSPGPPSSSKHRRGASDETDADLLILNSDFRAALVASLSGLDELDEGRLTIEQFASLLKELIGVSTVSVSTLLVGRYVS
jgi:hypothetical protein